MYYVIIPVYKAEKFLERCIDSVLSQTCPEVRIILVDDGSPDRSGDICDRYAENHENIHVIHQQNQGGFAARRTGIRFVKEHGRPDDFMLFLDSDDYYHPDLIRKVDEAVQRTHCDLVIYRFQQVNEKGAVRTEEQEAVPEKIIEEKNELYRIVFGRKSYNSLCQKAVMAKILSENYDPMYSEVRLGEDLLQSLEIYRNCERVSFLPDRLYYYYDNGSSVTNTLDHRQRNRDYIFVRKTVNDFLENEKGVDQETREIIKRFCASLFLKLIRLTSEYRIPRKERCELLRELSEDEFFMKTLAEGGSRCFQYRLFLQKKYRTLCVLGDLWRPVEPLCKRVYYRFKSRRNARPSKARL